MPSSARPEVPVVRAGHWRARRGAEAIFALRRIEVSRRRFMVVARESVLGT